ncbi:MAG: FtsB family cell division protein [Enterococcus sp.]
MKGEQKGKVTALDTDYAKSQYAKYKEQQKKVVFRRRRLGLLFGVALLIFGFVGVQLFQDYQRLEGLKTLKEEAIVERDEVKADVAALKHDVALLNDDEYVAKLARSRYFYSKDGELVYPLPEVGNQDATTESTQSSTVESSNN